MFCHSWHKEQNNLHFRERMAQNMVYENFGRHVSPLVHTNALEWFASAIVHAHRIVVYYYPIRVLWLESGQTGEECFRHGEELFSHARIRDFEIWGKVWEQLFINCLFCFSNTLCPNSLYWYFGWIPHPIICLFLHNRGKNRQMWVQKCQVGCWSAGL